MKVLHYVDERDLSWAVSWIQLLEKLAELGVENQVICKGGGSLFRMLKNHDIPVHAYDPMAQWWPVLDKGLKNLIETLKPQIIHTRLSAAARLGGYWGKRLGLPVVQTIDKFPKAKYHRDASLLLPCSLAVAEHMTAQGFSAAQIKVIPNGINTAYYRKDEAAGKKLRETLGIESSRFLILGAGRFVDWKGFDDLIAAFAQAAKSPEFLSKDPLLLLTGSGEDENRLRTLAAQSGVEDRIRFHPFAEDIRPFMWAADVFVQPSWGGEAFGIVLIEAMASSLAPIACRNGGMRDMIEDGVSGKLVPVHSPESLSVCLEECAADTSLRFRLAEGAQKRSKAYDIAVVAAMLKSVYQSVISGDQI